MTLPVYGNVIGQTSVSNRFNSFVAGQIAMTSGYLKLASFVALETIYAGLACYTSPGFETSTINPSSDYYVQLPRAASAVLNAPQQIAEGYTTNITMNGVAIPAIVAADASPQANLSAVAVVLAQQTNIASAVAVYATNSITVTATTGNPVVITVATLTYPGGAGTIVDNWTTSDGILGQFWGVSVWNPSAQNLYAPKGVPGSISAQATPYLPNSPVQVMQFGAIAVAPETMTSAGVASPITNASPVYVRTTATPQNPVVGAFRGDSDAGNAILVPASCAQWLFGTSATIGGTAILNITCSQGGA